MSPPQPLRLGMIGLSANATTSWASAAHLPPLLTAAGKAHYTIVALCNSSKEAAEASIQAYKLGPATHAYGSPTELAADADVQVVSCNTRVDRHHQTILPSIKAGKDVYLEWPIASNRAQVAEVVAAARQSGSRVAVGLQGRWAPPVLKIKELLESGRLGRVLSSELRAYGGLKDRQSMPTSLQYFAEKEVGGNPIVIGFGHTIDWVQFVLGELDSSNTHAHLQIQRSRRKVVEGPERKEVGEVISDVPDLISVHGTLQTSPVTAPGATLAAFFRVGQPFPGQPSLLWTANCEYGEVRLVSATGLGIQADPGDGPISIHVHDFRSDAVEELPWSWSSQQLEVPVPARCVQQCLYALAEGNSSGYVRLDDAARRAEQIFGWLDQKPSVSS